MAQVWFRPSITLFETCTSMMRLVLSLLLQLLLLLGSTQAFMISSSSTSCSRSAVPRRSTLLRSEESDNNNSNQNNVDTSTEQEQQQTAAQQQNPAQAAELRGLKMEIEELEKTLVQKRKEVERISDQADEYSKTGYARKVAEMENMRRMRSRMNSSSKSASVANLLTKFLPVMDNLNELKQKYEQDEFGKQYTAIGGALRTVFTGLGVTEFAVQPGDEIDESRVIVEAHEHSEEFPANTVIRTTSGGIELEGHVIVPAACVASMGSASAAPSEETQE